jgi:hypothetical protein
MTLTIDLNQNQKYINFWKNWNITGQTSTGILAFKIKSKYKSVIMS